MDDKKHDGGLMTTEEVARQLRTSPDTVRYWRHTGYGPPGTKVGRRVLYDRMAVQDWLKTLRSEER